MSREERKLCDLFPLMPKVQDTKTSLVQKEGDGEDSIRVTPVHRACPRNKTRSGRRVGGGREEVGGDRRRRPERVETHPHFSSGRTRGRDHRRSGGFRTGRWSTGASWAGLGRRRVLSGKRDTTDTGRDCGGGPPDPPGVIRRWTTPVTVAVDFQWSNGLVRIRFCTS